MYCRIKTNLIGLAVALGFVLVGFGLGEPPRTAADAAPPTFAQVVVESSPVDAGADVTSRPVRRGALMRQLAMPYISFAALTPRQEP
jgi:hypothetical protein